ncbi:MAG: terminase family protein, partial [Rikenellaceae bacterium]|nr:terminase family protein [Rikenellaceae bacterium]
MAQKLNLPTKLAVEAEVARRSLAGFARVTQPNFELSKFHTNYYAVLELFARGVIKKLIVSIPPQHGKSLGSSILLPAYMLGLNPDLKICIASYSLSLAAKFNRSVQRIISSNKYSRIFPQTKMKTGQAEREYVRTAENFDVVNHLGGVLSVGREGPLTGNRVDVMILDDIYRDAMEANSQIIRKNAWEWYTSVVRTRLHNDSAELIVFTRWHRQDIVGLISEHEPVVKLKSLTEDFDSHKWYVLNFQAIKDDEP